jgi:hypothetical protein
MSEEEYRQYEQELVIKMWNKIDNLKKVTKQNLQDKIFENDLNLRARTARPKEIANEI